jgi:guanylate kinase
MSALGTLFILSAPSGGGKTSLVESIIKSDPKILVSVSHTTRSMRPHEVEGQHYYFVDKSAFERLKEQGQFLETAEVFGNWYGTSKTWVEAQLEKGFDVFLDIDWQGAQRIREQIDCVSIFMIPPSKSALVTRLQERKQDDASVIARRMQRASAEMSHYAEYDYLVVNDDFNEALADLKAIVRASRRRLPLQEVRYSALLKELITENT